MIEILSALGWVAVAVIAYEFFSSLVWWLVDRYTDDSVTPYREAKPYPELLPLDQIPDGREGARTEEHATHCRQEETP